MTLSGHLPNYGHNIHQTLVESIDLLSANVAGEPRYLALCIRALFIEGIQAQRPTFTTPLWLFRNVMSVNGQPQPWLWQNRPYFAEAAGEQLVFRHSPTDCAGCGRKHLLYGSRDSRNRVFCSRCPIEYPVAPHPTDPLILRHRNTEVVFSSMPTAVWPDQFPVASFQNLIKEDLDEVETPIEVDGRDWDELVGPSWFG